MATYDAYDPYDGATQFQSNQQSQNQQSAPQPSEGDDTSGKSLNSDQKKAIAAAGVGTAALGAAAYGLSMLEDSENSEMAGGDSDGSGDGSDDGDGNSKGNPIAQATIPPPTPVPSTPPTEPIDPTAGLTGFDKAFAEARAAFGAGHTFEYEGQTYNTYTKEEEANLTPEQRNEFLADNNLMPGGGSHGHHQPGTALASNEPIITIDGDTDVQLADRDGSVSVIHDDAGSVSIDNDLHHGNDVATLDDHAHDHHYDAMNDLHDPAHDFDNHADVSDFT